MPERADIYLICGATGAGKFPHAEPLDAHGLAALKGKRILPIDPRFRAGGALAFYP